MARKSRKSRTALPPCYSVAFSLTWQSGTIWLHAAIQAGYRRLYIQRWPVPGRTIWAWTGRPSKCIHPVPPTV